MTARAKEDLAHCRVVDYGVVFETGRPVRFHYVRNTEKSPNLGPRYGQDIEPAGRYVIHNPNPGDLPLRWEQGVMEFKNPLVIKLKTGGRDDSTYGPTGWKARLSRSFGGRKGRALSCHLKKLGHDGVVTCFEDSGTAEIVKLYCK